MSPIRRAVALFLLLTVGAPSVEVLLDDDRAADASAEVTTADAHGLPFRPPLA